MNRPPPRWKRRYQWQYPDPEYGGSTAECIDKMTGKCVCRYDLGHPADYHPDYGGLSENEMLEQRGLDPFEPLTETVD